MPNLDLTNLNDASKIKTLLSTNNIEEKSPEMILKKMDLENSIDYANVCKTIASSVANMPNSLMQEHLEKYLQTLNLTINLRDNQEINNFFHTKNGKKFLETKISKDDIIITLKLMETLMALQG